MSVVELLDVLCQHEDLNDTPEIGIILGICEGLLVVDNDRKVVRLIRECPIIFHYIFPISEQTTLHKNTSAIVQHYQI